MKKIQWYTASFLIQADHGHGMQLKEKKLIPGIFCFFGFVVGFEAELGYFTLSQLQTAKKDLNGLQALPIERDLYFTPCRLTKVKADYSREHGVSL